VLPQAQKTESFETSARLSHSLFGHLSLVSDFGFRISNFSSLRASTFEFRNYSRLLLLAAVACFFSFSSSAPAEAATSPLAVEASDFEGLTADTAEEESVQAKGTPARLPGGPVQVPNTSADRAKLPSRCNLEMPRTTTTTPDPITLRRPGLVPAFLFPTHSSDSLHEHIRERAPPAAV
jgi:hypothetical protein